MRVIYATESFPKIPWPSIFLAGPTPRESSVKSWRPEALDLLAAEKFEGFVFVPEDRGGGCHSDYMDQVEWEEAGLEQASCISFWIPRELSKMPGLTTNDEWGTWKKSGKVVLGAPPWAAKVRYQRHYATKLKIPQFDTLHGTMRAAIQMALTLSTK